MSRDAIGRLNDALSRFGRIGLCTLPRRRADDAAEQHLAGPRRGQARGLHRSGFVATSCAIAYVARGSARGRRHGSLSAWCNQHQRQVAAARRSSARCHCRLSRQAGTASVEYGRTGNACLTACSAHPARRAVTAAQRASALAESCRRRPQPCRPYGVSNPLGAVAILDGPRSLSSARRGFHPAIALCPAAPAAVRLVVGARVCLPTTRIVGIISTPSRARAADVATYGRPRRLLSSRSRGRHEVVAGHCRAASACRMTHIEAIRPPRRLRRWCSSRSIGQGPGRVIALIRAAAGGRTTTSFPAYRRLPPPSSPTPSCRRSDRCSGRSRMLLAL